MSTLSVAVCIPTYNQAAYLEAAVHSALAQTQPCEIWISDDASTDETPAVIARLLINHPQIKHVRQKQNLGMSGNPRWVVQQPSVEYIVKLDSDDELHPQYVEILLNHLVANPTAGYAHVAVQEVNDAGQTRGLRCLARSTGLQSDEESLRASVTGYRVAANICMFRRTALQQVDYYRTDLNFADDWDLAVRLADAGWGNVYVNEVLASYRVWDTPDKTRSRRKLAELEGCRRVFEESLEPAFKRRSWSEVSIVTARRRLASRHAACLRSNQFTETEQEGLRLALGRLGDSSALRRKIRWIRTPIAPLFDLPEILTAKTKALAKTILYKKAQ